MMDLRDWLIVIGAVIMIGILIDGFRRMRIANKDSLKMSRDMGGDIENTPIDEEYNPELPSGGARVVGGPVEGKSGTAKGDALDAAASLKKSVEKGVASILGESESQDLKRSNRSDKIEPVIDGHSFDEEMLNDQISNDSLHADSKEEGGIFALKEVGESDVQTDQRLELESVEVPTARAGKQTKVAEIETTNDEKHALVLVINVHATTNKGFSGVDIKGLLEACGLEHGDMSIFHRHEEDDLLSPIQFSVANAIEPGYFDPNTLDQISTPGVSFFMTLPGPKDYSKAFEYMLETAQCFAKNLHGELKDENLSVMTPQTISHCRQQIKDFERRQLSKSKA